MKHVHRISLVLAISIAFASIAAAQGLNGSSREEAQRALSTLFLNRQVTSKITFPGWKDGIDLKTDGSWNLKWVTRQIKDHGVGIEVGDKASVTDVRLKDKTIEIHLNGGGAGTLGDMLLTSSAKKRQREGSGGKVPGGSRINLVFDRPITVEDIRNVSALIGYLEPVVDAAALQQAARQNAIPDQYKEAAARKQVVVGMDKATVLAIMGEPKSRSVDTAADPPLEKWVFETSGFKSVIVTFQSGGVLKVEEI